MKLAIFDLDNTLLAGDSDLGWGHYLVARGLYDAQQYGAAHAGFYQDYLQGCLDIYAYQKFQLRVLIEHPLEEVLAWRADYVERTIKPMIAIHSFDLIEKHRAAGALLLIITATNRFVSEPIAELLGIDNLIATEPEQVNGRYTGELTGIPSYAEGKVKRLHLWAAQQGFDWQAAESWFYSDSHNDIPLLEQVTHPVAVDPDDTLRSLALQRGWAVISLR